MEGVETFRNFPQFCNSSQVLAVSRNYLLLVHFACLLVPCVSPLLLEAWGGLVTAPQFFPQLALTLPHRIPPALPDLSQSHADHIAHCWTPPKKKVEVTPPPRPPISWGCAGCSNVLPCAQGSEEEASMPEDRRTDRVCGGRPCGEDRGFDCGLGLCGGLPPDPIKGPAVRPLFGENCAFE